MLTFGCLYHLGSDPNLVVVFKNSHCQPRKRIRETCYPCLGTNLTITLSLFEDLVFLFGNILNDLNLLLV